MLDYFALGLLIFVLVFLFYGIIALHDIPYEIAKKRHHPHKDAIHVAGWVSLFTLHAIWPFLWIWATLYDPETGWKKDGPTPGSGAQASSDTAGLEAEVAALRDRVGSLESLLAETLKKTKEA